MKRLLASLLFCILLPGSLGSALSGLPTLPLSPQTSQEPSATVEPASHPAGAVPVGAAAPPVVVKDGKVGFDLGNSAYLRYVDALVRGEKPEVVVPLLQDYFHAAGFNVPAAQTTLNEFDENETITFTYNLGDVDGDKIDDIALDSFCVDYDGCYKEAPCQGLNLNPECLQGGPQIQLVREMFCGTPHRLALVSGVNGTEIWRRDLGARKTGLDVDRLQDSLLGQCFYEVVVGQGPSPDGGSTLLIYKWMPNPLIGWRHSFAYVDRLNGADLWRTDPPGRYDGRCLGVTTPRVEVQYTIVDCENVLVNPLLQVPPSSGVAIVPKNTVPALFLQGVGFRFQYADTSPLYTETTTRPWIDDYQPKEWAERINFENGAVMWHKDTFTPYQKNEYTSVLPKALPEFMIPLRYFWNQRTLCCPQLATVHYYWNYVPCCFDTTGDGIPDLPFTTWEWNNRPSTNNEGPYELASSLVVIDGLDGKRVVDTIIEPGTTRFGDSEYDAGLGMYPYFELLGDANGDGVSDFLLHKIYFQYDYRNVVEVRNGKDGAFMWNYTSPRDVRAVVIGDADKDGGNDFILVDWFDWEHYRNTIYDFANTTAKPVIMFSGRDGKVLWRAETYMSPSDLMLLVRNYRINGIPDLNGDGAGEFPTDDPIQLADLTIVHRYSFRDARDGSVLYELRTVGTYAVPSFAGNITGDANHDLAMITGDVMDLWLTIYDGGTGEAVWSRRALTNKITETSFSMVWLRFHPMRHGAINHTLMNFQFEFTTYGGYQPIRAFVPQIAHYAGVNGTSSWAYPRFWDANLTYLVKGPSPASLAFQKLVDEFSRPVGYAAATSNNAGYVGPGLLSFGAAVLVAFGVGRRWRK